MKTCTLSLFTLACLSLCPSDALAQGTLWQTYNDAGIRAAQQGKPVEGERLFRLALQEAQKSGTREQIAQSLINIGKVLDEQKKFAEAEKFNLEALSVLRNIPSLEDSSLLVQALTNIAVQYNNQGKYKQAEDYARKALEESEAQEELQLRVAKSLTLLGQIHYSQGDYLQAEALLERAINLGLEIPSTLERYDAIFVALYFIALTHEKQGKYEVANKDYLARVKLTEDTFGDNHPIVAKPSVKTQSDYLSKLKMKAARNLAGSLLICFLPSRQFTVSDASPLDLLPAL